LGFLRQADHFWIFSQWSELHVSLKSRILTMCKKHFVECSTIQY